MQTNEEKWLSKGIIKQKNKEIFARRSTLKQTSRVRIRG